jgi:type 1 glutamine amidotransferase
VGRFGRGRTFALLLGHDPASMDHHVFRWFLTRGTEWAATGTVTPAVP